MAAQQKYTNAQINQMARQAIKALAIKMEQQIYSTNSVPANVPVLRIPPNNVGLLKGFWVKVVHTVSNASDVQINLTDFGPANALSMVKFKDLQGNYRIECSGRHLHLVNTMKARRPFGAAIVKDTGYDTPVNYGVNFINQISAPATIDAAGTGTVTMWYWIPLAYSDDDLRGSVYGNVVNGTMQIELTFPVANQGIAVANGTDTVQAMYVGDVAGSVAAVTITNALVTIYQVYMDQLPTHPELGVLLPVIDLATIYELKETSITGFTAAQNFGYQYPNFRDILATYYTYMSASATGLRGNGSDINFFSLQAANMTNIWQKEPGLIALQTRNFLGVDTPPGLYYFGSREKPIVTTQYGNMQLINNPVTAGAGAYAIVGIEDFALVQSLSMAGSLQTA